MTAALETRVLVVDDSAFNRQTITTMLESEPGVRVVGRASDGEEGLVQALALAPDVITLDLEMPRMDGFTFLRILMSRQPTPVIVISSHATRGNLFRALELGAFDFVPKPTARVSPELRAIKDALLAKLRLARDLRLTALPRGPAPGDSGPLAVRPLPLPRPAPRAFATPLRLVCIGASTGGPAALATILGALDPQAALSILVAQHMPPRFTQAFAERLDRLCPLVVREAQSGEPVLAGQVLVAPGGMVLEVARHADGRPVAVVRPPAAEERFAPSIDRLFESAAALAGEGALAVVLTGMAGEGPAGVRAVKAAGGRVLVQSTETAVMGGMPEDCVRSGLVDRVLPLRDIAAALG